MAAGEEVFTACHGALLHVPHSISMPKLSITEGAWSLCGWIHSLYDDGFFEEASNIKMICMSQSQK
jgi:hypothetical protein